MPFPFIFFFQAEDGIRDPLVTGVQTCALPISLVSPTMYGDGLRCAGGSLKRLFTHSAVGGSVTVPQGADLSISARSAALGAPIPAGAARFYQMYYRDPSATF